MRTPTPGRVAAAAGLALCLGLTIVVLFQGFDPDYPMRLLEDIAVVVTGAVLVFGPVLWIALRMGDWRTPEARRSSSESSCGPRSSRRRASRRSRTRSTGSTPTTR